MNLDILIVNILQKGVYWYDIYQGYAAKTVFEALQAQACHENMVKVRISTEIQLLQKFLATF